jgi:hypothetical protein
VLVPQNNLLRVLQGDSPERDRAVAPLTGPTANPLAYLAAVVRGEVKPSGLSSLAMNLVVTEILDAARESAATGQRIDLPVAQPHEK